MPTLNARPGRLDINTTAGDDLSVVLTHVDENGTATAVAASWLCEVLDRAGGTVLVTPTVTRSGGSDNILTIPFADIATGKRECVWRLHDVTNDRAWLAGKFTVEPVGTGTTSTQTNAATVRVTSTAVTVTVLGVATGGGGGATNLAYTASPTQGVVTSDTGTDATITLADGTNAGLMAPAQHTKLAGVESGATADMSAAEILAALLTVDGTGSGLDADLLDGNSSAAFATAGHNHTGTYDPAGAAASEVAAHEAVSGAHDAANISFTPTGSIAATDVQAAIAEVASEAAGAPTDATYVTLSANGSLSAEAVLGTDVIAQGNRSGRPAAGTAGKLYVVDNDGQATDDVQVLERDDGAAWQQVAAAKIRGQFAPNPSGTRLAIMPGVQSGQNTNDNMVITSGSSQWWLQRAIITDPSTCTGAVAWCSTALAGSNVSLAMWKADTDWKPSTLVRDFGTASTATTGWKTGSDTSSTTLRPGRYILGMIADNAMSGTLRMGGYYGSLIGGVTGIISGTAGYQYAYANAAGTYGTVPDPGPTGSYAVGSSNTEWFAIWLILAPA